MPVGRAGAGGPRSLPDRPGRLRRAHAGGARAEAQYLLAHSWLDEGNRPEAIDAWETAAAMPGMWPVARSEAWMVAGTGLPERGRVEERRSMLRSCVEFHGGEPWHVRECLLALGRSYLPEGRTDDARRDFRALRGRSDLSTEQREEVESALSGPVQPN